MAKLSVDSSMSLCEGIDSTPIDKMTKNTKSQNKNKPSKESSKSKESSNKKK